MEIAESALVLSASERRPRSLVRRELGSIHSKIKLRIGAKIGRDLFGPKFIDTESVRFQGWIHCLKFAPHLFPGEAGLCPGGRTHKRQAGKQQTHS